MSVRLDTAVGAGDLRCEAVRSAGLDEAQAVAVEDQGRLREGELRGKYRVPHPATRDTPRIGRS
jgi:hypothetical protein